MAPHNEEARMPLVANSGGDDDDSYEDSGPRSRRRRGGGSNSVIFQRFFMVITLALMAAGGVIFQMEFNQLNIELEQEEAKISELKDTLHNQAMVIQRFNQSVSNSDVLKRLSTMEHRLNQTQIDLEDQLRDTTEQVATKLDHTLKTLDATVQAAKADIQHEVDTVEKDFQQYMVETQDQFSMENSFMVYQLAGTFTLLSCLISMWHMTAHLRKLKQPVIQRKILAILWMSPIYAITSWFSLVFPKAEGYLAIVKDAYEAYIIYQFLSFCIAVLGKGDRNIVVDLLAKHADHLTPPFRLFFCCGKRDPYENDRALADAILLQCQMFAMQFVLFRPLTTVASVFLAKYDYYGPWADSPRDWRAPQVYVTLIQNMSIFTAFGGLLKFYHAVDADLAWCRPFAKFLCIKGVVFMTFWQGLAITVLAETTDVGGADADVWAKSAQNFLICLEMLLFSIAHFYCFPTDEWDENYQAKQRKGTLGDSIAFGDFVSDIKLLLRSSGSSSKKKKKKKKLSSDTPTVPEEEGEEIEYDDDDDGEDETSVTSDITGATSDAGGGELVSAIAKSLRESDDPELQEARQRILDSNILEDLSFSPSPKAKRPDAQTTPNSATDDDNNRGGWGWGAVGSAPGPSSVEEQKDDDGYVEDEEEGAATKETEHYDDVVVEDEEECVATEETGLLSRGRSPPKVKHSVPNDSMLRPSLFTTLSDISTPKKE